MSSINDDTSIISRLLTFLWDHTVAHAYYVLNFGYNHESLKSKMDELRSLRDYVMRRIEIEEVNAQMTRTPLVDGWLRKVETVEREVEMILRQSSQQIEDWWTFYEVGREICKKLKTILELCEKCKFETLAEKSAPGSVHEIPVKLTEGMEEMYDKVWGLLGEDHVKVLGIFGMGGVGKTLLMKKINNAFLVGPNQFNMVIWVVVSSELAVSNIQKQIGERLGLLWLDNEEQNKQQILNALRKKKFLVLLDDLRQAVELESIGIPSPHNTHNNSKVVFTTRSESVCGRMGACEKLRVPTLDRIQAWCLFRKKVGQESLDSDRDIRKIAQEVVKICDGLPSALVSIGSAMSSKKTIHEWEHARTTLTRYAHEFADMKALFCTLKSSYDGLENDAVKYCFLYCSLYPKDTFISVHGLVLSWIAEGYLDKYQDKEDAMNRGFDIIGILNSACLLEYSSYSDKFLRIHNIVRELALWIVREKNNKWFVEDFVESTQSLNVEVWKSAERVSLKSQAIIRLPPAPECPNLRTLRFQRSSELLTISNGFFMYMPILRILDLSHTGIKKVPESVGNLLQLQSLDLSHTGITEVPESVGNLTNLRFVDLGYTPSLRIIPFKKISRLSRLDMLVLFSTRICITSADLECVEHVRELGVTINEMKTLDSILLSHRLKYSVRHLYLFRCKGLTGLARHLGIMKKLEDLTIRGCLELKEFMIGCQTGEKDMCMLSTLEFLRLHSLPKLNITWNKTAMHLHFKKLWSVIISKCELLKDISWILLAPNLTLLRVEGCPEVELVLLDEFPRSVVEKKRTFSSLQRLRLIDLPKLERISKFAFLFPCLEDINVTNCPLLRKLPFTSDSTNKPSLRIEGSSEWWNNLQWQDKAIKSSFQPFFIVS